MASRGPRRNSYENSARYSSLMLPALTTARQRVVSLRIVWAESSGVPADDLYALAGQFGAAISRNKEFDRLRIHPGNIKLEQ